MRELEAKYIAMRSEQLAIMALTRVAGAVVSHAAFDAGIDFLVSTQARGGNRLFGVEVKGAMDHRRFVTTDKKLKKPVLRTVSSMVQDAPFPVAILVMGMSDDTILFGWVLEPVLVNGVASLAPREEVSLSNASHEYLSRVFQQVDDWYDGLVRSRQA